ncbi:MAG TPA: DNA methyltransferase [Candidatus Saccharimonadales bacterium]|nr:DNA methyltransferase [Candidatus Saccharimonadales bacterium]
MTHKSIFILGRQPAIGRAELESLFGADHLEPIGEHAMASDIPLDEIPFERIGGSIRLAKPIGEFPTNNWPKVAQTTIKLLPNLTDGMPLEGKIKVGISTFGLSVNERHLLRTGLEVKKALKAAGRSVRVVPNNEPALNTAQVLHNQLTGNLGLELLFIRNDKQTYLAQTVSIQDIDAYTERDRGRPKRDAFVGMLPPKLAQTIINLSTGQLPATTKTIVLDPFCGTGVVLQEALLMGYGAYGTDLEPRMIDYSRKNLEWLETRGAEHASSVVLEVGDATEYKWEHPVSVVAGETYLGRPLSNWPNPEKLQEIISTCNVILKKFLVNLAEQIPSGTRLCLAMPAWVGPNERIYHLSLLDSLEVMGYNRVSFSWSTEQEMVYRRPEQLVARELLVITRK